MKIFISADIEGTTGIAHWNETEKNHPDWKYFADQMTREVAAACQGAMDAGCQDIVVKDAHDSARNIDPRGLPECARLHRGWAGLPGSMMMCLDGSFDGCVFTGYHSGASWGTSPLSHTMNLGNCYAFGFGVAENDSTAIRLFEQAAVEPKYMFVLGEKYFFGDGILTRYPLAVKWYEKAAEGGYTDAMYNLGCMYLKGQGVEKDEAKAVEWWTKGAKKGDSESMLLLAVCYQDGVGVKQSASKSSSWLEKAAEANNLVALKHLGLAYYYGRGKKQNQKKAFQLFEQGAKIGDASIQYCLAVMFMKGEGCKKDLQKGALWLLEAAKRGDKNAKKAVDELGISIKSDTDGNKKSE